MSKLPSATDLLALYEKHNYQAAPGSMIFERHPIRGEQPAPAVACALGILWVEYGQDLATFSRYDMMAGDWAAQLCSRHGRPYIDGLDFGFELEATGDPADALDHDLEDDYRASFRSGYAAARELIGLLAAAGRICDVAA